MFGYLSEGFLILGAGGSGLTGLFSGFLYLSELAPYKASFRADNCSVVINFNCSSESFIVHHPTSPHFQFEIIC